MRTDGVGENLARGPPAGDVLDPGERLRLVTGTGTDTATTRYWGRDRAVWNNDGDVIVVRRDGEVVLRYEYS